MTSEPAGKRKNKGSGRKWGRQPLGAGKRRRVEVWLDPCEEMQIAAAATAAGMPRGRFIRRAALGRRIEAAPPVTNLRAWSELARLAANLNQLVRLAHATGRLGAELQPMLARLGIEVAALRAQLLGADEVDDQAAAE